jgi:5'-methylthioadenosine phosphorylase
MQNIAVITSTGLRLRDQLRDTETMLVQTRAGEVPIVTGLLGPELRIYSLIRSGFERPTAPHLVNYLANMLALKSLGVDSILATSVTGALQPTLKTGDLVVADQFLDFTRHRPPTVFDEQEFQFIDFTQPYCPTLRRQILESAADCGYSPISRGCYVGVDGPRYETAAEVQMFRLLGGDIIGMSNIPEAIYARELAMCYATICIVANPAAGLSSRPVLIEDINASAEELNEAVIEIISSTVQAMRLIPLCDCVPKTRLIKK